MEFKKGDKVRFVRNRFGANNARNYLLNKVFTIEKACELFKNAYEMRENKAYYFYKDELELVDRNKEIKIDVIIDPRDSDGAHRAVDKAIAEYKKQHFDWTEEELEQARELFKELAAEWVLDQNDILVFSENQHKEEVRLEIRYLSDICGTPRGNDVFNPLIGKVVCLCKALNKPIPDFINNKNR